MDLLDLLEDPDLLEDRDLKDQKTLLVAGVMVDSFGAAILTGWSRGIDAKTVLTVVGEELVCTVVYGDCGPSGGPSCP